MIFSFTNARINFAKARVKRQRFFLLDCFASRYIHDSNTSKVFITSKEKKNQSEALPSGRENSKQIICQRYRYDQQTLKILHI